MAKRKYKVGDKVTFRFAGSEHQGQITVIEESSRYQINDGKYTYPIQQQHILGKVK
tara:strand:+ start:290 stop:457 length:168 start_codon:yes stop_codon:yes gene_type:complete